MKSIKPLVLILILSLNHVESYPYFPNCSPVNGNILTTLNGNISGACYNVSVNSANGVTFNSVMTWLAVPYAQPPVNNLRFANPVPYGSWNSTLDGTNWPNPCIQVAGSSPANITASGINSNGQEDCLYLNIFVPYTVYYNSVILKNVSARAPIYLFIHGGSFDSWASSYDQFEPSTLVAASNMIVVTIQYRLASFGFMYINGTNLSGNQAIWDQNMAMQWVYNNSALFGGDNTRITIGGQSAGSQSVGYHLLFPPSWPYFTNAILESGTPIVSNAQYLLSTSSASNYATKIGNNLNCSATTGTQLLNCFQNSSSILFNTASSPYWPYAPVVLDGVNFKMNPIQAFQTPGMFKNCNILVGSNSKEYAFFEQPYTSNSHSQQISSYTYANLVSALSSSPFSYNQTFINNLIQLYNNSNQLGSTASYLDYLIQIQTDFKYRCPTMIMSNLTSNYGFNVFSYYYNYQISSSEFQPLYSAVHADELAMVFAQPLSLKAQPFLTSMNYWPPKSNNTYSSLERNISSLFVNYWSNFVATGNVNRIGNQMWSVWNQNGGSFLNMTGITNLSFTPVNTIYSMAQDTICQMLYPQWVW